MNPNATPASLSAGLTDLRYQMAVAFTGQKNGHSVRNPITFGEVAAIGREAKEALPRYSARP